MTDHKQVYQQDAERYQRLISWEDYQGNLLPAIQRILPAGSLDLIDLGTGTGRLACLLAPLARRVFAFDASTHMLGVGSAKLAELDGGSWLAAAAEHLFIPLPAGTANLVISGWSICYLVVWEGGDWRGSIQAGLREMERLVRHEGRLVIIETLGTGVVSPDPPDELQDYLNYLEEAGFQRDWIRTDYRFPSRKEAEELVGFFFGPDMIARIGPGEEPILPECTGLWSLTIR